MTRLTQPSYWDTKYDNANSPRPTATQRLKTFIRKLLGRQIVAFSRDYSDYLLWHVFYETQLPHLQGAKVLEVGSAPGDHLVKFREVLGYEPFGVEYSAPGAHLNRDLFKHHGLNPDNIIHGDFFSAGFQNQFKDFFDVVVSRGFIEHFTDPVSVIDAHLNVLRTGGHLVITIPNLRGVNHVLMAFFYRDVIPMHNLTIMRYEPFSKLFSRARISPLLCQYYGTFNFGLFFTDNSLTKRFLLAVGRLLQRLLNVFLRLAFGTRGPDSRHFSPYLIFIGVKKE